MKPASDKLDGIFLLDKPLGRSSHFVLRGAQRLLLANKAGHTGSLDPLATGMLPLCFGEATKFSRFFLEANKRYAVKMQLGVTTTTGDSEGAVIEQKALPLIRETHLQDLKQVFQGTHLQIPPMFSALKHKGQPLYRLARQGKAVERTPREVTIYDLAFSPLQECTSEISFEVECSKGTYIRSLVEEMGNHLGCGAHVSYLRRQWVDPFRHYPMMTLEALEGLSLSERRHQLLPISMILDKLMPSIVLSPEEGEALMKGREIPHEFDHAGWVSLMSAGKFLGVGESTDGLIQPRRLVQQLI